MTEYNFEIARPWLLLILVPALILGIIPFFKLHKKRRKATKHIIPFIIHMVLVLLLSSLLAGFQVVETRETPENTSVVFVVDVSRSNKDMKEDMNEFMHNIVEGAKKQEGETYFGLVLFANEVISDVPVGELDLEAKDYIIYDDSAEHSESNICDAIEHAGKLLGVNSDKIMEERNKRIILLSDGRETDNGTVFNAHTAVKKMLENDVSVDAAYFDILDSKNTEVQVVSISTNNRVELNGNVTVNVEIRSTKSAKGKLIVHDGDFQSEERVDIVAGDNKFRFEYTPQGAGIHTIYAEIKVDDDIVEQNNIRYAWYTVDDKGSMLIVTGDDLQTRQIESVLEELSKEYVYEIVPSQSFPTTMEKLLEYDEIVLMNVDFKRMPAGADAMIERYVSEVGRGLVVTSGNNTYDYNQQIYQDSPIKNLLPVEMKIEDKEETVAIAIAIDLSSSMRLKMGNEGKTRYDVALEATLRAIDGLDENKDYIGVVFFDNNPYVAVDMMPLKNNVENIKNRIKKEFEHYFYLHYLNADGTESDIRVNPNDGDTYTKEGYIMPTMPQNVTKDEYGSKEYGHNNDYVAAHGTKFYGPINEVSNMFSVAMKEYQLDIKQLVFMSDGQNSDKNLAYKDMIKIMASAGIVTSTIGVSKDCDGAELGKMSTEGKGDFVEITDAVALPEKLYEIANSIKGEKYNVRDVKPLMFESHPLLKNVNGFDIIGGYYGTTVKQDANLVVYVDNLKPIIAEWNYGLGNVSVFMSNLGSTWTEKMFDDEDGVKNRQLVKNLLIGSMNAKVDSTGISIKEIKRDDKTTYIRVDTPVNVRNAEDLYVTVKNAATGEIVADGIVMQRVASRKYRTPIPTEDVMGTYIVEIKLQSNNQEVPLIYDRTTFAVVGTYAEEYDLFSVDGKAVMNDIAKADDLTNTIIKDASDFYDIVREETMQIIHDAKVPLATAALVLFLLSIFFRNFIFQKSKENKQMTDEEQIASMRGR